MGMGRRSVLLGLGLLLTACASAGPTESVLDPATQKAIVIDSVTVDSSAMGATTAGQQVPTSTVVASLQNEAQRLVGRGEGTTPARVLITLESVNLIALVESALPGAESTMKGTVSLVDARSGRVILPPQAIESGGGGATRVGVFGVATRRDTAAELQVLSEGFVDTTGVLIFGN